MDVKQEKIVPAFGPHFADNVQKMDKIILDLVPPFAEDALKAKGVIDIRVFNVGDLKEEEALRKREERENSESVSVYDFVMARLSAIDSRIVTESGTRFSATLRDEKKMAQKMQYGSEAMEMMANQIQPMRDRLNSEFRLGSRGRHGAYTIKPFNLVSPDITGVTDALREKYRVRHYTNAVHEAYNGLNPFEVQVASALDTLGLDWCRNPQTGYGIPIAELGADVQNFYPDFLLWTNDAVWALDPKGAHLKEAAAQRKLFDVTDVAGVTTPVRVALILQGNWTVSSDGNWSSSNKKDGFTLARRLSGNVKAQPFANLNALARSIVED